MTRWVPSRRKPTKHPASSHKSEVVYAANPHKPNNATQPTLPVVTTTTGCLSLGSGGGRWLDTSDEILLPIITSVVVDTADLTRCAATCRWWRPLVSTDTAFCLHLPPRPAKHRPLRRPRPRTQVLPEPRQDPTVVASRFMSLPYMLRLLGPHGATWRSHADARPLACRWRGAQDLVRLLPCGRMSRRNQFTT